MARANQIDPEAQAVNIARAELLQFVERFFSAYEANEIVKLIDRYVEAKIAYSGEPRKYG